MDSDCPDTLSLGPYFGMAEAAFLQTVPLDSSPISVTKIARPVTADNEARVVLPGSDAYLMMVYLEDTIHSDIQSDGSIAPPRWCGKGSVCVVDLCEGASVVLRRSLSSLAVYLPKALIEEVARTSFPHQEKKELRCRRAEPDQVVSNLSAVILSLFDRDPATIDPILRHLSVALCTHLLQDCLEVSGSKNGSILPVDLEIAAKDFMRENLARELTVAEIARVTGLPAGQFAQGFKNVTGLAPHQWLMQARVAAAKGLLAEHELSIREIARACGFVDQSHFTKVFSKQVGTTPAQWRGRRLH